MRHFTRVLLALGILGAGLAGCSDDESKPEKRPEPPRLNAVPAPGTYDVLSLDVAIDADVAGLTYYFGIDEAPDLTEGYAERLRVRLNRGATILVNVRDEAGKLWGPYSFAYELEAPVAVGYCSVAAARYYYRPSDPVSIEIDYGFATGISLLYYSIDGRDYLVGGPDVLAPAGAETVNIGKIAGEGAHEIACKIMSGDEVTAERLAEIFVDGTPPSGAWLSTGGAFDRASWPGEFRVQASDGGSGVASVALCKSGTGPCLELEGAGPDAYAYATALTGGSAFQASLTPVVTDRAGNQTVLPALSIDTQAFGEPPPAAPLPVTLTTAAAIDLNALLSLAGRAAPVAEARSLDLATSYGASALPLTPGWNDFLYRQPGRNEWESFGIYRAGFSAALPASASPWLVFASESTTPALQGALVDVLPAGPASAWAKAWFDVPHVWFVADRNANQAWDDGDELYASAADAFSGPYQARFTPVAVSVAAQPGAAAATQAAKTVECTVCDAGGELYFEWRQDRYGYPVSHAAFPAVTFSPVTSAPVSVWSDPAGWCGFFWDENGDGAANGREPRAFGPCGQSTFALARQEVLAASFAGGELRLSGLPYGGAATGELLATSGAEVLVREAVLALRDVNGTGAVTAAVARAMTFPYSLRIHAGGQTATATLPAGSPAQTVLVEVRDENDAPRSAVAVIRRGDAAFGAVYQAGFGHVAVGMPTSGPAAEAYALRDGYLSVAGAVTYSAMTLRLLSPAVTSVLAGTVRDRYGFAVSNATLTWSAFSYRARVLTDSQGGYSLPVSGYSGVVHVAAPGPYLRESYFPLTITGDTLVQDVVMADEGGPAWPLGANLGIWPEELSGAYLAPAYAGDRYYAANVTTGVWTVRSSYGTARQATLPGALPPLAADGPSRKYPPSPLALGLLDQYARCGARLQLALPFVGAVIDSPCWGWFASDGVQEYFLGPLSPDAGFPAMRGFGIFNAEVSGPGAAVVLVDVLLGRKIRVPVGTGAVREAVPVGIYDVRSEGGGAASPARLTVYATDNPSVDIALP